MIDFIFSSEFFKRLFTSIVLLFCMGGAYLHSIALFSIVLGIILILILIFEWPKLIQLSIVPFLLISIVYPALPIFSLIYLNYKFHSINLLLPIYPFLVAWTADTFGYIFGKTWGVYKICPSISPGKSWEGLFGSFVGVFVFNFLILPQIHIAWFANVKILGILLISILFTLCAFSGGILISILKRRKGLKDAGDVLPGHGGFLDRFDSVFACALLLWLIILM